MVKKTAEDIRLKVYGFSRNLAGSDNAILLFEV